MPTSPARRERRLFARAAAKFGVLFALNKFGAAPAAVGGVKQLATDVYATVDEHGEEEFSPEVGEEERGPSAFTNTNTGGKDKQQIEVATSIATSKERTNTAHKKVHQGQKSQASKRKQQDNSGPAQSSQDQEFGRLLTHVGREGNAINNALPEARYFYDRSLVGPRGGDTQTGNNPATAPNPRTESASGSTSDRSSV
ncbi:unnamed protein product [Amoebophrya sp. A120]|nr:unnamed protein product [Amoebophrya sp. A120]|eukprot:GSA120T00019501001.1